MPPTVPLRNLAFAPRALAWLLGAAALAATLLADEVGRGPGPQAGPRPRGAPAAEAVVLNDDGGWCWFQDERAIVVGDRLVLGTVAAGRRDAARRGVVEVTGVDLVTGAVTRSRLSTTPVEQDGRYDDHDAPAFAVRADGRLLAVWAGHHFDNRILSRVSTRPGDPSAWGAEQAFVPSPPSRITYSNLHRLAAERGRIYDFFRGLDDRFKPSVAWSDDDGETWTNAGVVIDVPAAVRRRPYVKYASDGRGTIHLAYTEGHPRDFDNSIYHVAYREGHLRRSDGTSIRSLAEGLRDPLEGTRVFAGDAANVAWVVDLELDSRGRPFVAYSVDPDFTLTLIDTYPSSALAAADQFATPYQVVVSPDGLTVYVTGNAGDSIATYSRNADTGVLSHLNSIKNGDNYGCLPAPCDGTVATRNSISSGPNFLNLILPSCGFRRSEMSRSHMILMRAAIALR